jgi:hypothetical protein
MRWYSARTTELATVTRAPAPISILTAWVIRATDT